MKTISVAAVTAGGKTTVVGELKKRLPNSRSLHFDDYNFGGGVEDFPEWVRNGADYQVWDLAPLEEDILKAREEGDCDYLLLDYPFAYRHNAVKKYIDAAFFIDTPLDIALARRILRDMGSATGEEIRLDLEMYLKHARPAFVQMHRDILPSSDYVIDGGQSVENIAVDILAKLTEGGVLHD